MIYLFNGLKCPTFPIDQITLTKTIELNTYNMLKLITCKSDESPPWTSSSSLATREDNAMWTRCKNDFCVP